VKKGQIVRVDKDKYMNSINVRELPSSVLWQFHFIFLLTDSRAHDDLFQYLSVGHPPFYKGLDYIYEDRGEVIDQFSLQSCMQILRL
jgi:hypothetical protein